MNENNLNLENDNSISYNILMLFLTSLFFTLSIYALLSESINYKMSLNVFALIINTLIITFCLAGILKKNGEESWKAFIPFYNTIVILKIVEKPIWVFVFILIPLINIFVIIWLIHLISLKFKKDASFTIGLVFLPFIFFPILAFDNSSSPK